MQNLSELENKYDTERIFLIGNGPSLERTPLEKLDQEYTLALNQIGRLYDQTDWRPSFYYNPLGPDHTLAPTDLDVVLDNCENDTICLLNPSWSETPSSEENVFYVNVVNIFDKYIDSMSYNEIEQASVSRLYEFWSDDISDAIYHYHTMYGAMQIAAYMGFNEIYFIGCDFGMEYYDPHMIFESGLDPYRYEDGKMSYVLESIEKNVLIQSAINYISMKFILSINSNSYIERMLGGDQNDHFTGDYFDKIVIQDGEQYENEIRRGHIVAKRICKDKNINMYNATLGGELEVFERVELNSILD